MIAGLTHDLGKKLRFARSFLRRRLVHVNLQILYQCNYRCRICVSVDYADPARHDAQRGQPGAHAKAFEALRALHENRTHPEQRVNLISVILDDNLADVEPLIRQCEALGITYLLTLYSHSRGSKPQRAPDADPGRQLLELKRQHRHFVALRGYLERFTEATGRGGIGPCFAGRSLCNIDSQGNVTLCIDRLEDPVGSVLTDEMPEIERCLRERHRTNTCRECWTSCRGSIESILYGRRPLLNLLDYFQMTQPVALKTGF